MKKLSICLILFLGLSTQTFAQKVRIAVAANAQHVIKILQADFQKKTGIKTEAIIGSSGKLTAQIKNGAPYDLFLSADTEFPEILYKQGFGTDTPRVYALGSLIVCSSHDIQLNDWQRIVATNKVNKIAIANPALAPYGKAAKQALQHYHLWNKVSNKIVLGESIAQVNTYITTGVVKLGFTTEAFIHENPNRHQLKWIRVDSKTYGKIEQGMLLLSYARKGNYTNALKFFNYLQSPAAKSIFKKNGYLVP